MNHRVYSATQCRLALQCLLWHDWFVSIVYIPNTWFWKKTFDKRLSVKFGGFVSGNVRILCCENLHHVSQSFDQNTDIFVLSVRSLNVADDSTGITPLQIAVETGNIDCIKEMLICGARLDVVDRNGCTVFHYAARSNNEMIIQVETTYSVSQTPPPWDFLAIFPKRLGIFSPNFTCVLNIPIYVRLQIFIQFNLQPLRSYAILSATTQRAFRPTMDILSI